MKQWFYDKRHRIYVDSRGVRLTDREIREALDEYIDSVQDGIESKVAKYAAGAITLAGLFSFLSNEVSLLHGAAGAIAYGGLLQMDLSRWHRVNERTRLELDYLTGFYQDAASMTPEAIASRASLYAEAAYSEYMNQVIERESDNGVTLGRRICEQDGSSCDECVEAATEEFIPLDEIPDIGSLQCFSNCRCEIEFQVGDKDFRTSDLFQGIIGGQEQYGGSEILS